MRLPPHPRAPSFRSAVAVLAVLAGCAVIPPPESPDARVARSFVRASGTGLLVAGKPWHFKGLAVYSANSRGNCGASLGEKNALDDSLNQIGRGQNAFRAWFFQKLATRRGARDWTAFDRTLAVARAHGEKVVATLANQWEDCEAAAFYKGESWYQAGYREVQRGDLATYRDWVEEVVTRYASNPTILAWQLMNEAEDSPEGTEGGGAGCSPTAAASLHAFARDVSGLVKSLDPNHLVSLGTIGGKQCGSGEPGEWKALHALPTIDLCEYHDYSGIEPITPDIEARIRECHALGKPIFAGEIGLREVPERPAQAAAKLRAQLGAGDVGAFFWVWNYDDPSPGSFDVGAGDPLLDVLAKY